MGYIGNLFKIYRGITAEDKTGTPARTAAQGLNDNADAIDAALEAIDTAAEKKTNKVTNLTAPNNTQYPTTKATADAIAAIDGAANLYTDEQLVNYQAKSEKGTANGYAGLDANLKVPAANLPGFVDEIVEGTYIDATTFNDIGGLAVTPGAAKIYQDVSTGNPTSGQQFRWGGTAYSEIKASPGTTDEVPEGPTNKYFTENRVRATVLTGISFLNAGAITAADSILTAFGKLQAQITAVITSIGLKLDKGTYNGTAQDLENLANSKETTAGAQSKADAAEQAAKDYAVSLSGNTIPVETFTDLAALVLEEDILYLVKDENVIYTYDEIEDLVFALDALTSAKIIAALGITPANDEEVVKKANNLSDLNNIATSRTNLDVYSKAESNALTGGGSGITGRYATYAALLADQVSQVDKGIYTVADASSFSTVDSGWADFEYLGTTLGTEADYRKLSEQESLDLASSSYQTEVVAAAAKTTPVDSDLLSILDSAAANIIKKVTWANIKATLKTYFDTLYISQIDIDVPVTVSASRNFAATDIGKVLYVTQTVTLTYPSGGLANFKTNLVCSAAGQATIAGQAAEILFEDGQIILAKKAVTLFKEPVTSKLTGYGEFSV